MSDLAQNQNLWFMNNACTIPVPKSATSDGVSVIDMQLPHGDAPPLHVHRHEDEIFHIIAGEVRFQLGGRVVEGKAGDTLLAPAGIPHGFRVVSASGARMLTITRHGFEDMLRAVARPAEHDGLPEAVEPSPALQAELGAKCAAHGIDLLGPPIA